MEIEKWILENVKCILEIGKWKLGNENRILKNENRNMKNGNRKCDLENDIQKLKTGYQDYRRMQVFFT